MKVSTPGKSTTVHNAVNGTTLCGKSADGMHRIAGKDVSCKTCLKQLAKQRPAFEDRYPEIPANKLASVKKQIKAGKGFGWKGHYKGNLANKNATPADSE